MNLQQVWEKVTGKYGLVAGAAIVIAIALLLWFGIVDMEWVMGLINAN